MESGTILLCLAAFTICFTVVSAETSNEKSLISGRIVNGQNATMEKFRYIAALETKKNNFQFCGGSIINPLIILSAAHCGYQRNALDLQARAGTIKRGSGGTVVNVLKIVLHEKYNDTSKDYDLAFFVLQDKITGSNAAIIPYTFLDPTPGEILTISGWGNTETDGVPPATLLYTNVEVIDRQKCNETLDGLITENMFCCYTPDKDSCQGDSGGPAVNKNGVLVGVISWGIGCAIKGYPGVYSLFKDVSKNMAAKLLEFENSIK